MTAMRDEINKYAHTPLYFILQPEYRVLNKAQKSFYALVELAYEINHIDPKNLSDTAIDDAFEKQKEVLTQLRKDYPQQDNLKAFNEAEEHLANAYEDLKKLRKDQRAKIAASKSKT